MRRLIVVAPVLLALSLVGCGQSSTPAPAGNANAPAAPAASKPPAAVAPATPPATKAPATQPAAMPSMNTPTTAPSNAAAMSDAQVVNVKCPVSGEDIDPKNPKLIKVVVDGKTYGLCCPDCIKDFTAHPQKYLSKAN